MPRISEVYAGQFVNAVELPVGRRIQAVITSATTQTVGQGDQANLRVVLELRSTDGRAWPKACVLNKTNGQMLAAVYGDEATNWINRLIEVWREKVMFSGRLVDAIRMSAAAAAPGASAPPPSQGAPPAGNSLTRAIPMPGPSPSYPNQGVPTSVDEALARAQQQRPAPRVGFDEHGIPAYVDAPGPDADLDDQIPF